MSERGFPRYRLGPRAGALIPGRGGWLFWFVSPDLEARVRVSEIEGLFRPTTLHVSAMSEVRAVTGTDLRDLPMGRLESLLRRPEVQDDIRRAWRARSAHDFRPEACDTLTALQIAQATPDVPEPDDSELLKLDIPSSRKRDDSFYLGVQLAYALASTRSRRPAVLLAEVNDVPVTTIHRWLREYKRRRDAAEAAAASLDDEGGLGDEEDDEEEDD